MTSSPNPSGVPPTPSAITPGLVVVAGLVVCWLTDDPLVLRTAATVATVAALIAVIQLTRNVSAVSAGLSAELRTQNREITRLRDAVNELHEQLGDQKQDVERVRREAVNVRDQAAQVREEAAALLEAADHKVSSLGGGSLASAFDAQPDPYAEPLTGPREAFPPPPPVRSADRGGMTFADEGELSPAPYADQRAFSPDRSRPAEAQEAQSTSGAEFAPPAASPSSRNDSDEQLGYLEDFSIQASDDEPLTQPWSAADDDADDSASYKNWSFARAERRGDSR